MSGLRGAVLVLVALAAAGCGGAGAVTEPLIGPVPVITELSQVSRPIDIYLPTLDELRGLWQVRSDAAEDCYARHGTHGRSNIPPDLVGQLRAERADDTARSRLYGLFDAQGATKYGYGSAPETSPLGTPAPWASPDVVQTCEKAGADAIHDLDLTTDERILPDGGPPPATNDSRFRTAVAKWSECLAKAGYHYDDPVSPLTDPKWNRPVADDGSQAPASASEIAAATADVKCKVSTNLVGTAIAVQSAYDNQYIQTHRDQLAAFRQFVSRPR
jgi:hypothetical protein